MVSLLLEVELIALPPLPGLLYSSLYSGSGCLELLVTDVLM